MTTDTTISRRQILAGIPAAAITPAAALAAKAAHDPRFAADDPVFAAIERHCQAAQALAALHQPPDALEQDGVTSAIVKVP
jgi:hypothetical protein